MKRLFAVFCLCLLISSAACAETGPVLYKEGDVIEGQKLTVFFPGDGAIIELLEEGELLYHGWIEENIQDTVIWDITSNGRLIESGTVETMEDGTFEDLMPSVFERNKEYDIHFTYDGETISNHLLVVSDTNMPRASRLSILTPEVVESEKGRYLVFSWQESSYKTVEVSIEEKDSRKVLASFLTNPSAESKWEISTRQLQNGTEYVLSVRQGNDSDTLELSLSDTGEIFAGGTAVATIIETAAVQSEELTDEISDEVSDEVTEEISKEISDQVSETVLPDTTVLSVPSDYSVGRSITSREEFVTYYNELTKATGTEHTIRVDNSIFESGTLTDDLKIYFDNNYIILELQMLHGSDQVYRIECVYFPDGDEAKEADFYRIFAAAFVAAGAANEMDDPLIASNLLDSSEALTFDYGYAKSIVAGNWTLTFLNSTFMYFSIEAAGVHSLADADNTEELEAMLGVLKPDHQFPAQLDTTLMSMMPGSYQTLRDVEVYIPYEQVIEQINDSQSNFNTYDIMALSFAGIPNSLMEDEDAISGIETEFVDKYVDALSAIGTTTVIEKGVYSWKDFETNGLKGKWCYINPFPAYFVLSFEYKDTHYIVGYGSGTTVDLRYEKIMDLVVSSIKPLDGSPAVTLQNDANTDTVALMDTVPVPASSSELRKGVCTADRVNVRQAPDMSARPVGRINRGDPLTVIETEGEWSKISCEVGEGYIKTQYIRLDSF